MLMLLLGASVQAVGNKALYYKISDKNSDQVKALFSQQSEFNDLKVISLFNNMTQDQIPQLAENDQFFNTIKERHQQSKMLARRKTTQEILRFRKSLEEWQDRYDAYIVQAKVFNVTLPQCDLECSAKCFASLKEHSAGYVFKQCLQPLCKCYNPPIVPYYSYISSEDSQMPGLGSVSTLQSQPLPFSLFLDQEEGFLTSEDSVTETTTEYSWTVQNYTDGSRQIDLSFDSDQEHIINMQQSTVVYVEPRVVEHQVVSNGQDSTQIIKKIIKIEEPQRVILDPVYTTSTVTTTSSPQVIQFQPQTYTETRTVVSEPQRIILGDIRQQQDQQVIKLDTVTKNVNVVQYQEPQRIMLDIPEQRQTIVLDKTAEPSRINLNLDSVLKPASPSVIDLGTISSQRVEYIKQEPQRITLDVQGQQQQQVNYVTVQQVAKPQVINLDVQPTQQQVTVVKQVVAEPQRIDLGSIGSTQTTTTQRLTSQQCAQQCPHTIEISQSRYTVQQIPSNYNLLSQCSLTCSSDCFSLKRDVPFYVLQQCVELKCNCLLAADIPAPAASEDCDSECANDCIDPFASLTEVFSCVKKCGCQQGSSINGLQSSSSSVSHFASSSKIESEYKLTTEVINRLIKEGYVLNTTQSIEDKVFCPCLGFWVSKKELKKRGQDFHKFLNCSQHYHFDVDNQDDYEIKNKTQTTSQSKQEIQQQGDQKVVVTTITTTTTAQQQVGGGSQSVQTTNLGYGRGQQHTRVNISSSRTDITEEEDDDFIIQVHEVVHQQNVRQHESVIKVTEQSNTTYQQTSISQEQVIVQRQENTTSKQSQSSQSSSEQEVIVDQTSPVVVSNQTSVTTKVTIDGDKQDQVKNDSSTVTKTTTTVTVVETHDHDFDVDHQQVKNTSQGQVIVVGGTTNNSTTVISSGSAQQNQSAVTIITKEQEPVIIVKNYTTVTTITSHVTDQEAEDIKKSQSIQEDNKTVVVQQVDSSSSSVVVNTQQDTKDTTNEGVVNYTLVNKTVVQEQVVTPGFTKIVIQNYTQVGGSTTSVTKEEVVETKTMNETTEQEQRQIQSNQTVTTTTTTSTSDSVDHDHNDDVIEVIEYVHIQKGDQDQSVVIQQGGQSAQTTITTQHLTEQQRISTLERQIELLMRQLKGMSSCGCGYSTEEHSEFDHHEGQCSVAQDSQQSSVNQQQSQQSTSVNQQTVSQQSVSEQSQYSQLQQTLKDLQQSQTTTSQQQITQQSSVDRVPSVVEIQKSVSEVVTTTSQQPSSEITVTKTVEQGEQPGVTIITTTTTTMTTPGFEQPVLVLKVAEPQVKKITEIEKSGELSSISYGVYTLSELYERSSSSSSSSTVTTSVSTTSTVSTTTTVSTSSQSSSVQGQSQQYQTQQQREPRVIVLTTKTLVPPPETALDEIKITLVTNEFGRTIVQQEILPPQPSTVYTDYQFTKRTKIIEEGRVNVFEEKQFTEDRLEEMTDLVGQISFIDYINSYKLSIEETKAQKDSYGLKFGKKVTKAIKKQTKGALDVSNLCSFQCLRDCLQFTAETNATILYDQCTTQCYCQLVAVQTNVIQARYNNHTAIAYNMTDYKISQNYSWYDDCDFDCGANVCADFSKGGIAWQVVDSCFKQRCNCHYEYAPKNQSVLIKHPVISVQDISSSVTCNRTCAYDKCLHSTAGLALNATACLSACGCTIEIQQKKQDTVIVHKSSTGGRCSQDYCQFFNQFKQDQIVNEDRMLQLIKSKALVTMQQYQALQENQQDVECNVTCVQECFNKQLVSSSSVSITCVESHCGCRKLSMMANYDNFLSQENNQIPQALSLFQEIAEQNLQQSQQQDQQRDFSESVSLKAQAIFSLEYTIKEDTCCLDFEWEFDNDNDQGYSKHTDCDHDDDHDHDDDGHDHDDERQIVIEEVSFESEVQVQQETTSSTSSAEISSQSIITKNASESISQSQSSIDVYQACDLACQRDCFFMKDSLPFSFFKHCIVEKCHCDYFNKESGLPNLFCNSTCRSGCQEKPTLQVHDLKCFANCGCDAEQEQVSALFQTLPGSSNQVQSLWSQIILWTGVSAALAVVVYVIYTIFTKYDLINKGKKSRRQNVYTKTEFEEDNQVPNYYQKLDQ